MPLRRHDRRLRPLPPGPSPRLRRGTATSLARSVLVVPPDLDGFLRRAAIRRPRPRRPAGLLRPAASHGVRQVSVLPCSFWLPADVVGPRFEALSRWRRPFEAFPSPAAASLVTAGSPSREGGCVHRGGVPSRRWVAPTVPCHHGSSVAPSTSGRCSTEESVAGAKRFRSVRPDAPMGFGSNRSDACRAPPARSPRRPAFGGPFRLDGTSRRGVRRHPRVARSASFSACLAPRGPMLELTRRSAARRSGSLAARRLLRFRSRLMLPRRGIRIGRRRGLPEGRPTPRPG
jgi:hypothetical protein